MVSQYADVLIIGGSMAGACLARQLKLAHPDMKITVIERKQAFNSWVGESTLESFWDYMANDLKLGFYLETNHLYKHGLRFYFDSDNRDLSVEELSELGRSWYHGIPAHQIDREKFDNDMVQFNRELGVDVVMGTTVNEISLDAQQGHTVVTSSGSTYTCRYLVDASGFNSPLGKQLGLIESQNDRHPVSSYWGRFKHIELIDHLGSDEWRARSNFTSRALATNHFMYKGYWIWLIPLNQDTFSIGITAKNNEVNLNIRSAEEFEQFLRSHQALNEILGQHAELLDYTSMKRLSRKAKQSFSTERWFLTGMSSAFLDPLLSPGSAYLTDANRMIGELIEADIAEDAEVFAGKTKAFNAYLLSWYESFMLHITGNYHGSYEVHKTHFEALLMHWFGFILPSSMSRRYGYCPSQHGMSQDEVNQKAIAMIENAAIARIHVLKDEFIQLIKGYEYRYNRGHFFDIELTRQRMKHAHTRGAMLDDAAIAELDHALLEVTYQGFLRSLCEIQKVDFDEEKMPMVVQAAIEDKLSLTHAMQLFHI
ncbi:MULTISPECIES: NAD(P)/FAD-dependent oxidoreductase [Pseudoalteromonas]|uniref:NAD(P)/FAD-dependent oxidoreductase n=2 Tax=Pseudoalteromonas TaxID=53246 RepID=UPI0019D2A77F|nr:MULTISPECIES: NAD(P)/FAD-dependent oxidoreductase [Pseudoalteromonas]MBR8843211.1 NAD(P)/FAD-dependent oxidoreductase [Pseudoalteromonas sp. JC3]MCF2825784.1 NAD(P)/FAD-dependent oxidoreductase [Pseudoalteromonas sp. OF5H-5]MCF2832949.1 NAD(P)/FAD-dependent oxidoreductase [Pseudoalteromonas sp. DL2-H6]MCF2923656.1 NAD(P)/FAD-dependent oxidoreductase [Pseudoalteromonas sp. DL2-H1]MCF7513840.1 NAD(P)/FAD-dependent oxidoreductase [Pseudoalteromonas sp. L7]